MILIQVITLAERLGVHRNTIRNWVKTGKIPARPAPGRGLLLAREDFRRLCEEFALDPGSLNPRELALAETREAVSVPVALATPASEQPERSRLPLSFQEAVMSDKVVGSVLVVGGGIAGIQAALDLADSGYYVYLVEKGPGIGGKMAQLDKTYPTNDCAM